MTFSDDQIARLDAVSRIELGFPHDMIMAPVPFDMFGQVKVAIPPGR